MYYIVIREARQGSTDAALAKEILYSSIVSHCGSAFYLFLFQEITLQLTVLLAAILFIFVGLPILWCVITLPIVAVLVYALTYLTHVFKASEVSQLRPKKQWVAEAHEPYFLQASSQSLRYIVIDEAEAETILLEADRFKHKIIGTVSLTDFHGPSESLWLYGLAVHPQYKRKGAGLALAQAALAWARRGGFDSLELATTDLQHHARLLFQNIGFEMRQMYYKQLLGAALTLTMFHQGIDLRPSNLTT